MWRVQYQHVKGAVSTCEECSIYMWRVQYLHVKSKISMGVKCARYSPYTRSIVILSLGIPVENSAHHKHKMPYSSRSRAHLAVSTEWVLSQANGSCLCKSISSFTIDFYCSLYDYIIHIALNASFQPPLNHHDTKSLFFQFLDSWLWDWFAYMRIGI